MIYGRRFFDSKKLQKRSPAADSKHLKLREILSTDIKDKYYRELKLKHVSLLVFGSFFSVLLFIGPAVYFLVQNYQIFQRLALDTSPQLVEHIERELNWFIGLSLLTVVSAGFCTAWLGARLINSIIKPIYSVQHHLRDIIDGDWSEHPKFNFDGEFRSFLSTYDYFHQSIQNMALEELQQLQQLQIDPNDKISSSIKNQLVTNRKKILAQKTDSKVIDLAEGSFGSGSKRRAS
jgi:hypothetical protein